ncbi:MAG: hypothetical protein NVS1B4_11690 [Gemmatimonadaceae bacterium]
MHLPGDDGGELGETRKRRQAYRRAIGALAQVVVVLVLLALLPIVIATRAQIHRRLIADTIEPARIAAGELEAYALERLLTDAAGSRPGGMRAMAARRMRDPITIDRQWAVLDSAAEKLGGDAVTRVAALAGAMRREAASTTTAPFAAAAALATVAAADTLQQWLDARVAREREAAIAVERWDVRLQVSLVVLAFLGVFALVVAGRQIAALGRVAERSAAALADATEAKAALLRGVTHDLKNPLGAAQGFTELLCAGILGELTDRSRGAVERIHRLLGDAINILKDLTELARAESGGLSLTSERTLLEQLVTDCVNDHEALAQSRGQRLLTRPHDSAGAEPVAVQSDPRRIRQILDNLLTNAIKYTPEKGCVTVSLATDPSTSHAHITVSDTGPGIPVDMRARIFDEFFRLGGHVVDGRATAPSGTGVGLAISRRLARLLGGDIIVTAAPEGGAAFTLVLPDANSRSRGS